MTDHQQRYSAWWDVELDRQGTQTGAIYVPVSTDQSAYRALKIPLIILRNGDGPVCLLTGGVHGDEWEGQIVADEIARNLDEKDICGTLIVLPQANSPACASGTRTSPLDLGNLNAAWPGEAGGKPTAQIADFMETHILPHLDGWIDLHTGGKSLIYAPKPAIHISGDSSLNRRAFAALSAFGAQESLIFEVQEERSASAAAQRHNVPYIYGEFGGGDQVSATGLLLAYHGTLRTLHHFGVLRTCCDKKTNGIHPTQQHYLMVAGGDYRDTRANYWFAPHNGLYEPTVALADEVREMQVVGRLHGLTGLGATDVVSTRSGIVVCLRAGPVVETGDCLGHIATPIRSDALQSKWC